MLNENAKKWVEALRSGKYQQVRGKLARLDAELDEVTGYCCLGVACELAIQDGVEVRVKVCITNHEGWVSYDGESGMLPPTVRRWLGIRHSDGGFVPIVSEPDDNTLTRLNDYARKSFTELADIIESEPKMMFVDVAA